MECGAERHIAHIVTGILETEDVTIWEDTIIVILLLMFATESTDHIQKMVVDLVVQNQTMIQVVDLVVLVGTMMVVLVALGETMMVVLVAQYQDQTLHPRTVLILEVILEIRMYTTEEQAVAKALPTQEGLPQAG